MMPLFMRPFVLWVIPAALILVVIVEWFGWRLTLRLLRKMGQEERVNTVRRRRLQAFVLFVGLVTFGLVAVAGPYVEGTLSRDALRAIFVLDVSWSMGAKDYIEPMPMRFERAKEAIMIALKRYQEGEVGLVVFAGQAFPWIPKMRDFQALEWMLKNWVELGVAPAQGSELRAGLEMAFKIADAQYRDPVTKKIKAVVIVVSDGTDNETPPLEALAEYQKEGLKVIAAGVGRPEVTQVTLSNGKTYPTRLNELVLKAVAEATGGTYVRVMNGRELADALSRHPEALMTMTIPVAAKDLYQWPLGVSLLFAVLWILRVVRR